MKKHSGHASYSIKELKKLRACLSNCAEQLPPKMDIERISSYAKIVSIHQVPNIPTVISEINALLKDNNASITDIAKKIEMDPVIAGEMIGTVNSPIFQRKLSKPVIARSVMQAIQIIGVDKTQAVVAASALKTTQTKNDMVKQIINHSALVAFACAEIAGYTSIIDPADAYLYGLFMKGGMLMIANQFGEQYKEIFDIYKSCPSIALQKERKQLNVEHQYLGVIVSRKWGISHLNDEILFAIQDQENPNFICNEDDKIRTYIAIGLYANQLVNEITEEFYHSSELSERYEQSQKALNFDANTIHNIRSVLSDTLQKYKSMQH